MYSIPYTVYQRPVTLAVTNAYKRYQKHHMDSAHESLSSYRLLHKKLTHLSLGSLEKMVHVEHRV